MHQLRCSPLITKWGAHFARWPDNNLGVMYRDGPAGFCSGCQVVPNSGRTGGPMAQDNLGELYAGGLGVPKDFFQAYMWNDLAAAGGQARATETPRTPCRKDDS